MNRIIIVLFVLVNFSTIQGQDCFGIIKTDASKQIFIHTENKFELDESKFDEEEILVESDNGDVKKFFKGRYMVKPNALGECTISIYNKDKSKRLYSEKLWVTYSVKPEIVPIFQSQENKITNNEIPKDRLEDLKGFTSAVFSQNQIIFLIVEMKLIIYSKTIGEQEFIISGKLNEEAKEKINSLNTRRFNYIKGY
jgi:hypothetical protein